MNSAPVSSQSVLRHLMRTTSIPDHIFDEITIATCPTIDDPDQSCLARTVVTMPRRLLGTVHGDVVRREIQKGLRSLPGAANTLQISMGREISIEWQGIRRPY